MSKHRGAMLGDVFVEQDRRLFPSQQPGKRVLSLKQRA